MKTDKESNQHFGCCSGVDDISVENSSMTCVDSTEVDECITDTKVKVFPDKPDFIFPSRVAMNLQFQDIKYTVGKFSFRNRKYGKLSRCDNFIWVSPLIKIGLRFMAMVNDALLIWYSLWSKFVGLFQVTVKANINRPNIADFIHTDEPNLGSRHFFSKFFV